jgi:hypothetical protein
VLVCGKTKNEKKVWNFQKPHSNYCSEELGISQEGLGIGLKNIVLEVK